MDTPIIWGNYGYSHEPAGLSAIFAACSASMSIPCDDRPLDRIDMTAAQEGQARVPTIINRAHSLKVVAEGVETEEQSRLLRLLSCDEMQRYLFSNPVPSAIFEKQFLVPLSAR